MLLLAQKHLIVFSDQSVSGSTTCRTHSNGRVTSFSAVTSPQPVSKTELILSARQPCTFCIYFNLHVWQLIFPSLMFKLIYSATSAPLFYLFGDVHLRHSWHRLDINMTTGHSHVSFVITASGGWWLGISIVTEADEWAFFYTGCGGKMSLQHKEGSLSWIINQFHMRGGTKHCRGEDILRGWCHAWGLVGVMSSGGVMSPILNTSDMAAEQFPCLTCKLFLFTYLYLWRM